jgi:hypothetical protein
MSAALFTEKDIEQRYLDFFEIAENFCSAYGGDEESVEIDPAMLYLAVVATYDDISRYKSYHLSEPATQRANAIKRAAYGVKWVVRFSPLIFPNMGHLTGKITARHDGLANAMFAVHFALVNLEEFTGHSINLPPEIQFALIYDLMYREISADALILLFETISESSENY